MDDHKAKIRNEILWELRSNEYDKDVLPHYGMVPDWGPRYHRIAKLIREYLDAEHTKLDEKFREAAERARHLQRESKSGETDITGC
jgi:hypothetical protein